MSSLVVRGRIPRVLGEEGLAGLSGTQCLQLVNIWVLGSNSGGQDRQQASLKPTKCFYREAYIENGGLPGKTLRSSDLNAEKAFVGTRLSPQNGVEAPADGQTAPAPPQERAEVGLHLVG